MVLVSANSEDSDEMLHYGAFHLGLHCLPSTHLGVSSLQREGIYVKYLSLTVHMWMSSLARYLVLLLFHMGIKVTKPVFGVSNKARRKRKTSLLSFRD